MTLPMSTDAAHRRWWQTFEVVFGIPLLAALALQLILPRSFPVGFLTPASVPCGAALITLGVALVVAARRQFARYHQPTDPGRATRRLITTGVFSISRNPLYLGGICTLLGLALALNLPWVVLLMLPAWVACHGVLVVPEERYLTATFGAEYLSYAGTVHRWVGRAWRSAREPE